MNEETQKKIRWFIAICLLIGVFHETGWFTFFSVGLSFVNAELFYQHLKRKKDGD